jgi:hypothetical protein
VGDCGAEVAANDSEIWATMERFAEHSVVQQFVPLAARFTALRDMAERQRSGSLRQGRAEGESAAD